MKIFKLIQFNPIDLFDFGILAILEVRSNEKRQHLGDMSTKTTVVTEIESK